MKTSKKWETLVTVMVSIAIIVISFVSIYRIIQSDKSFEYNYSKSNNIWILERNANFIIKKLDLSKINIWEDFYIYKTWALINVFTWTTFKNYQYIDNLWNNIDLTKNQLIYSRICTLYNYSSDSKYIKCKIKEILEK